MEFVHNVYDEQGKAMFTSYMDIFKSQIEKFYPKKCKICIVGLAAGVLNRSLAERYNVVSFEIDKKSLAHYHEQSKFFGKESEHHAIIDVDFNKFIRMYPKYLKDENFDVLILDAFGHDFVKDLDASIFDEFDLVLINMEINANYRAKIDHYLERNSEVSFQKFYPTHDHGDEYFVHFLWSMSKKYDVSSS